MWCVDFMIIVLSFDHCCYTRGEEVVRLNWMSMGFYKVILFRKSYDFKIIKRKKQTCLGSYISQNEIILHHEIIIKKKHNSSNHY
jgi:hypothetical protein